MIRENYISKIKRDLRYNELKHSFHNVRKKSMKQQYMHPQYVQDYSGIIDKSHNNGQYKTYFKMLYIVEEVA